MPTKDYLQGRKDLAQEFVKRSNEILANRNNMGKVAKLSIDLQEFMKKEANAEI